MLYFSILVPLPAECSESVPSCNVSFAYTLEKFKCFAITYYILCNKHNIFFQTYLYSKYPYLNLYFIHIVLFSSKPVTYSFIQKACHFHGRLYTPYFPFVKIFRIISTGIMVNARTNTTTQPVIPNGTQLNISPITPRTGTNPAFTISACTRMMMKNTFRKPVFSFSPLKIPNPSSRTLNPLNSADAIKSTK